MHKYAYIHTEYAKRSLQLLKLIQKRSNGDKSNCGFTNGISKRSGYFKITRSRKLFVKRGK